VIFVGRFTLDAKLYDDGSTTLGDTITRGLWIEKWL
jgi:hypothetical protein